MVSDFSDSSDDECRFTNPLFDQLGLSLLTGAAAIKGPSAVQERSKRVLPEETASPKAKGDGKRLAFGSRRDHLADDGLFASITSILRTPVAERYGFQSNLVQTLEKDRDLVERVEKDREESEAKLQRAERLRLAIDRAVHKSARGDKQWPIYADKLYLLMDEADTKQLMGGYTQLSVRDFYMFREPSLALQAEKAALAGRQSRERDWAYAMASGVPIQAPASYRRRVDVLWSAVACLDALAVEGYLASFKTANGRALPADTPSDADCLMCIRYLLLVGCLEELLKRVSERADLCSAVKGTEMEGEDPQPHPFAVPDFRARGTPTIDDSLLELRSFWPCDYHLRVGQICTLVAFITYATPYTLRAFYLLFQITCLLLVDKRLGLDHSLQSSLKFCLVGLLQWFLHSNPLSETNPAEFTRQGFSHLHYLIQTTFEHPEHTFRLLYKMEVLLGSCEFGLRNLSKWLVVSHITGKLQFQFASMFNHSQEPDEARYFLQVLPYLAALVDEPRYSLPPLQGLRHLLCTRFKFILMLPLLIQVHGWPTPTLQAIALQLDACLETGTGVSVFHAVGGGRWLGEETNCKVWARCVKQVLEVELRGRKAIAFQMYN